MLGSYLENLPSSTKTDENLHLKQFRSLGLLDATSSHLFVSIFLVHNKLEIQCSNKANSRGKTAAKHYL